MIKEYKPTGSVETIDRFYILAFNKIYITMALFWLLGIVQGPLVSASAIDSLSTIHPQGRVWVTDGTVYAIHQQGGVLYLGGEFQKVGPNPGGVSALKIASAEADSDFPLVEGKIFAIASDGDGNLYLGGNFDRVGVFARSNLVKLNPDYSVAQAWRPAISGPVTALEVSDNRLFIGGNFRGRVSKLSVTEAVRFNADVTVISDISATRIDSSEVIGHTSLQVKVPVGSYLTVVDLNSGRKDLTWNPEINGQVTALKVVGDLLFAGGEFVIAGGVRQSYFAAFSKETGRLVEDRFRLELNRPVRAIHQRGKLLYVGGEFTQVGKQSFPYLFAGNLTTGELVTDWKPAPNLPVTSLDSNASNLFVGGRFTEIAGSQKPYAAAFSVDDGSLLKGWEPLPDAPVLDLKVLADRLYLGGDFTNIGGVSVAFVAAMSIKNGRILPDWSPTSLTPVSRLFIHSVSSQIESEDTGADADGIRLDDDTGVTAKPVLDTLVVKVRLIATGGFVGADWVLQSNVSAINISKGDIASTWKSPTVDGPVYSLEFTGQHLAVGGDFNRVNGEKQENFVRIQLKTGEPILNPAESVPWPVFDMKIIDRKLYVAGGKLSGEGEASGGVMVASLFRDSGFQEFVVTQKPVFAIDSYEDRLVLGGRFVSINQERRFGLALVDLSTGDLIPDFAPKLTGEVRDFLILEKGLFIVGEFQHVNGLRRQNVAAFNIESGRLLDWSPRVNGRVNSVVTDSSAVYLGGAFSLVAKQHRTGLAAVDSAKGRLLDWNPSPDGEVFSLYAQNDRAVIAGGEFLKIGNTAQASLALLEPVDPPSITDQTQTDRPAVNAGTDVDLNVTVTGAGNISYQWRRNGVILDGENSPTLSLSRIDPKDAGSFELLVINEGGVTRSLPIKVAVDRVDAVALNNTFGVRTVAGNASGFAFGNNTQADRQNAEPNHGPKLTGKTLWLTWTAPAGGIVEFNTKGSDFDTFMVVYSGDSAADLTRIIDDDDQGSFFAGSVRVNARAGESFHVVIDGFAGAEGIAILNWEFESTVDRIAEILNHPVGGTRRLGQNEQLNFVLLDALIDVQVQWFFNGVELSGEVIDSLNVNDLQADKVGTYFARIRRGTREVFTKPINLQIHVRDDGEEEFTVTSEDKFGSSFGRGASLRGRSGPGRPGQVGQAGRGSPGKRASTSVSRGFTNTQIFNTFGSTTESGEPSHCNVVGGASQWFSIQPDEDGILFVDTNGSDFDTVLAVYTSPDESFQTMEEVACDNDSGFDGEDSSIAFEALAGTLYYIAVDGVEGATGVVLLNYRLIVPPSGISISPAQNITAQTGDNLVLEVLVEKGTDPEFSWLYNDEILEGEAAETLSLMNIVPETHQGQYVVIISNDADSVPSDIITLTFSTVQPPQITTQPIDIISYLGGEVSFSFEAAGSGPLNFQWSFNGESIPDQTDVQLQLSQIQTTDEGRYSVTVSNSAGSVTSNEAELSLLNSPLLHSLELLPNDRIRLRVDALESLSYRVETSSDLDNWGILSEGNVIGGFMEFPDVSVLEVTHRFYRISFSFE